MNTLISNYRSWLSSLDQDKLVALADGKMWVGVLVINLTGVLACSFVPVISDFFQMEYHWPLIFWLILCFGAFLESSSKVRDVLPFSAYGLLRMAVGTSMQLFFWGMVVSSSLMGGTVLAAFAILVTAFHGQFYQVSLQAPYGLAMPLVALSGAFFLDSSGSHTPILLLGGFMSMGACFVMGGSERNRLASVKENEALRSALDAQILFDRTQELENVQSAIKAIRGTNHDASNVLSGILMNLQFLTSRLTSVSSEAAPDNDLLEISGDLDESVSRLRKIIEKGRDLGGSVSDHDLVSVRGVLEEVVKEQGQLFPQVQIRFDTHVEREIRLAIPGGEVTLARIIGNLVRNACEGEGVSAASEVQVQFSLDEERNWAKIVIRDNGPGFTTEQLQTPISQLRTTKSSGTGLGLYTTYRLLGACKGQLELGNGAEGGAEVSAIFPLPR